MKTVQRFTDKQLRYWRSRKPLQILRFLEDFRVLYGGRDTPAKSTRINVRVQEPLLRVFRARAAALSVPYQTQIKRLMEKWALEPEA